MKKTLYTIYKKSPPSLKRIWKFLKYHFLDKESKNPLVSGARRNIKELGTLFSKKSISFVSFTHMIYLCDTWLPGLGRDFDVIVGIPRSGLLVANVLSLKLGKPLTTPENIHSFWCSKSIDLKSNPSPSFLLVDDSYQTGASMQEAIDVLLKQNIPREKIKTAALITSAEGVKSLDFYALELNDKRLFEWNVVHKKMNVVADMDGVLCEEPPEYVRDDEVAYQKWLQRAKSLSIPAFEINTILTSRIEKYRPETEEWLRANAVKYRNLVMSKETTREAQRNLGLGQKILEINKIQPDIYWESGAKEADEIFPKVKCPVLVFETKVILSK